MKTIITFILLIILTGCAGMNSLYTRKANSAQPNNNETDNDPIRINGKNIKDNIIYLPVISHKW